MGYGITSESQLIDIATIRSGCNAFISALESFGTGANQITDAGHTCNNDALSVDGNSFETDITGVGQQIGQLKDEYASYAEAVYAAAVQVYNDQVTELNNYRAWLASQQNRR